jgi:hypothetical protein
MTPATVLTRDQILAADDITIVEVDCTAEWGGAVCVRLLSARGRWRYFQALRPLVEAGEAQTQGGIVRESGLLLAAASICDASGALLFTEADVEALAAKSWVAMNRVIDASADLNGLTPKAVDDAKKNSAGETATSGSSTDSPAT